ncbi:alkaline phosphatase [Stakelama sp. CBK3Z-3]|uniref:Alkaline phosphatase n=1 Tax=Stakelama flava TaxID=2860338 RepID=A0ABS6XQ88_9SPHN|nr:hypothetical protein [Stakelama flava]MBW4332286.1 alkaline phosphatase [Stakelama flava]
MIVSGGDGAADMGTGFDALAKAHDRPVYAKLADVPATTLRPIVLGDDMDVHAATSRALDILQASDDRYMLMVEWDAHTDDPKDGLQHVADFDALIAKVEQRVDLSDTLLLFTADHSFGLQVDGGRRGSPLLAVYDAWKAAGGNEDENLIRLDNVLLNHSHTAEEVPALTIGAGSDKVRGYLPAPSCSTS